MLTYEIIRNGEGQYEVLASLGIESTISRVDELSLGSTLILEANYFSNVQGRGMLPFFKGAATSLNDGKMSPKNLHDLFDSSANEVFSHEYNF